MGKLKKLNPKGLKALIEKPGRYGDGQGLFFKTVGSGKSYWTYRFTVGGKERETSLGPFPEVSLDEARIRHLAMMKAVKVDKIDPLARKRAAKTTTPSEKPTFGVMADLYVKNHESAWRNAKHRWQWSQTLTTYAAPLKDKPVDQVTTADVLACLTPLWTRAPETGRRSSTRQGRLATSTPTGPTQRAGKVTSITCCPSPSSSAVGTTRRSLMATSLSS